MVAARRTCPVTATRSPGQSQAAARQVAGVGNVDAGRVPDVEVAALRVDQADMVLGMSRRVVALEAAPAAEVDAAVLGDGPDAPGRRRRERAEQLVERVAVDHPRTGHQPGRVGQVPRAALVHDDLRRREHLRDVARPAGVIEMDMGDDDSGEIAGPDAEAGEGIPDHRRGRPRSGLHQAWPVTADQVASRDPVIAGHHRVDLEYLVPEVHDRGICAGFTCWAGGHPSILAERRRLEPSEPPTGCGGDRCPRLSGRPLALVQPSAVQPSAVQPSAVQPFAVQPSANRRRTRPVRGLGPNDVDFFGTRSPAAAIAYTSPAVIGGQMTAGDVYAIAAAGERVPRKSTSFGPKPRTGLVLRLFAEG